MVPVCPDIVTRRRDRPRVDREETRSIVVTVTCQATTVHCVTRDVKIWVRHRVDVGVETCAPLADHGCTRRTSGFTIFGIIHHHTVRLPFTCSGALNTAMHDGNFVVVSKSVAPMHTQEDLQLDLLTLTPVSGLNPAATNLRLSLAIIFI